MQFAYNQEARVLHGVESDGEEDLCHATNQIFASFPKKPMIVRAEVQLNGTSHEQCIDPGQQGELDSTCEETENLECAHNGQQGILPPEQLASPLHEAQVQAANAGGNTGTEQKEKLARDSEESHQQKITRRMSQEQRTYVAAVSSRCLAKLEGRDVNGEGKDGVENQVDRLLHQATNPENLCRMYEGWTPWI